MSDEEPRAPDDTPPARAAAEGDHLKVNPHLTSRTDADGKPEAPLDTASDDRDGTLSGKQAINAPGHVATTASSEAGGDGVVRFDYAKWAAHFPEMAEFTPEARAETFFEIAQNLYLNNSAASIVRDLKNRAWLFDLLVAHLAWLSRPEAEGGAGPGSVGPVTEARQGSIAVRYDLQGQPPSATWFMQSQFGAAYWQAISAWRSMRFIPARASRAKIWP
ncbi:DUF4054 domain-containing protein [Candidatus Kirkpatrickella diaphorinae]|uniref:DUF4054 domain-containing protein n=1 Tax=Candidatus Kirkpatrickella diaphorinae TaxID=2984322 RepID=A0ABY6GH29_9PROT|nr:DUF4054 domain-containing protein [Candidatus Kirkpatrickella diaphorinae]UYH50825.1 DUF4054 domain-containing protein [Candidatus Kirkpatrickella diaphorinae]